MDVLAGFKLQPFWLFCNPLIGKGVIALPPCRIMLRGSSRSTFGSDDGEDMPLMGGCIESDGGLVHQALKLGGPVAAAKGKAGAKPKPAAKAKSGKSRVCRGCNKAFPTETFWANTPYCALAGCDTALKRLSRLAASQGKKEWLTSVKTDPERLRTILEDYKVKVGVEPVELHLEHALRAASSSSQGGADRSRKEAFNMKQYSEWEET
eukprot:5337376-Amphidinium_carterae.1